MKNSPKPRWIRILSQALVTVCIAIFANNVTAAEGKPLTPKEIDSLLVKETGANHTIQKAGKGALISCPTQALEAEIFQNEFKLHSLSSKEGKGSFSFIVNGFGKGTSVNTDSLKNAEISVSPNLVKVKGENLTQEFSTKYDGIRQDFIIHSRPAGKGKLILGLDLLNAKAKQAEAGVKVTMKGGREFIYGKLLVTDATGKKLIANFDVPAENKIAIVVDDKNAKYPVRIDPTVTDANWSTILGGVSGDASQVFCAAVDSADNLYIGGDFTKAGAVGNTRYLAVWDGTAWLAVGKGVNNRVRSMDVDDADNLYVGGDFTKAGNDKVGDLQVNYMAKYGNDPLLWTPTNDVTWRTFKWRALATGADGPVYAIAADKDGVGNISKSDQDAVYFGGSFTTPSLGNLTKWEYTFDAAAQSVSGAFSGLKSGVDDVVYALDVDLNKNLYVGGVFGAAWDGTTQYPNTARLAKWEFTAVPAPGSYDWASAGAVTGTAVNAIAIDGVNIYVGGNFSNIGGTGVGNFAWSNNGGATWTANANNPGVINALAVDGAGNVYAGGTWGVEVSAAGNVAFANIGAYITNALAIDSGNNVYAGGVISGGLLDIFNQPAPPTTNQVEALNVVVYDGAQWFALQEVDGAFNEVGIAGVGPDYNNNVNAITSYCGAVGPPSGLGGIYIGGAFTMVNGIQCNYVAQWDADLGTWKALGDGLNGEVGALVFDKASNVLYVGGAFTMAGSIDAMHMAKYWNDPNDDPNMGLIWGSMGDVLTATEEAGGYDFVEDMPVVVTAMCVDGDKNVYAGGSFTTPGKYVAKFAGGGSGSAMGSGVGAASDVTPFVYALACDSSNNVYIGGGFTEPAPYLTKWSGSYSDIGGNFNKAVLALAVDSVDMLYVGGSFTSSAVSSPYIAKYDIGLLNWSAMGNSINGPVFDLTTDSADFVYAGGDFSFATGDATYTMANNIAQWDGTGWNPCGSGVGGGAANQQVWAISYNNSAGKVYVGGAFDTFKTYTAPAAVNRIASLDISYLVKFEVAPYYGTTTTFNGTVSPAPWAISRDYELGDQVMSTAGDLFNCTTAGTSGATEPAWNTDGPPPSGLTTNDNTVVWTQIAPANDLIANSSTNLWQYVLPGGTCDPVTAIPDPIGGDNVEYFLSYWTGVRIVGDCGGTPCIGPWTTNAITYGPVDASATLTAHFGRIIHVNQAATAGANDGTNWANAYTDLQSALTDAKPYDMIWVAKGTYYPSATADRAATFLLKKFVRIYGGFAGTETLSWAEKRSSAALSALLNAREIDKNKTILSGDVTADKSAANYADDPTDNSYHIVTGPGFDFDGTQASVDAASDDDKVEELIRTRLDGFTVESGYADGVGTNQDRGASVFIKSIPVNIEYCTIKNNYALAGAAIYASNTFLETSPCYLVMGCPTALINKWPIVIINTAFVNNTANTGGAIAALNANISFYLCTFGVNNADIGGAISLDGYPASPSGSKYCPYNIIQDSIFYSNKSTDANTYDNIALKNSAQVDVNYSNIVEPKAGAGFVYGGPGNMALDPYFVNEGSTALRVSSTNYQLGDVIIYGPLKKKYVCIQTGQSAADWAATTAYVVGDYIFDGDYWYECTVAGTSAGAKPTFPTVVGNTVGDGTVTWTCQYTYAATFGGTTNDGTVVWQYQAWDPTIDLHLQSTAGHYTTNGFVYDNYNSPSIDKSSNVWGVGNETAPNGGVANMGAYGWTIEASRSGDVGPSPAAAIFVTKPNSTNFGQNGLIFDGATGRTYNITTVSQGGAGRSDTTGLILRLYKGGVLVAGTGIISCTPVNPSVETYTGSGRWVSTYTWNIDFHNIGGVAPNLTFGDDYYIRADDGGGNVSPNPGSYFSINRSYPITFNTDGTIDAEIRDAGDVKVAPNPGAYVQNVISGNDTAPMTAYIPGGTTKFVNWTWHDPVTTHTVTSTDNPLTIMVNGAIADVTANFAGQFTLTTIDNDAPGTDQSLYQGDTAALLADNPPAGQQFSSWTSSAGGYFSDAPNWQANTAYGLGTFVSDTGGTYILECTTAGTSAGTEPVWNTDSPITGLTTADNTAVWTQVVGAPTSSSASTTFTMPGNATTVTANYINNTTHNLTVTLGTPIGPTAVPEGGSQTITADNRAGAPNYENFTNWTCGDYWAVATAYVVNDFVTSTDGTTFMICTTGGTSDAATEPTWPASVGGTVAEGPDTLVWTRIANPFTNRLASPTDFTMGVFTPAPVTVPVFAKFTPSANYGLTVVNGTVAPDPGPAPGGNWYAYDTYAITGVNPNPATMYFVNWNTPDGGTFGDANLEVTTYTMPDNAATITANYALKPTLTVVNGTDNSGGPAHDAGVVVDVSGTGVTSFVNWTTTAGYFNDETDWAATSAYALGDYVASTNGLYRFECTTAGTSAGGEPVWNTDSPITGLTTTDGTAVWTQRTLLTTSTKELNTRFIMPSVICTITANYTADPTLTMVKGTDVTGGPTHAGGTLVTITADAPPAGQFFHSWSDVPVTGGLNGTFTGGATASTTTYTMPVNSVTVTANFTDNADLTVVNGAPAGPTATAPSTTVNISADADTPTTSYFSNWTVSGLWQATTAYVLGDQVFSTDGLYCFECTTAGTSAGVEPAWNTDLPITGLTTNDGTVVWTQVAGGIADPNARNTTFTMPGPVAFPLTQQNVTVTAVFTGNPTLNLVNAVDLSTGPTHVAGSVVNIAGVPPVVGMHFSSWTSDNGGTFGNASTWTALTPYALNDCVRSTAGDSFYCTTAGTSGAVEPAWNTNDPITGLTTNDGTVVWTQINHTAFTMPEGLTTVTANYVWYLRYTTGGVGSGSISGTASQDVANGADGSTVTAVADPGSTFFNWSDGVLTAARTDLNVGADITVTATFIADPNWNGSLTYGSVISYKPAAFTNGDNEFVSRPTVYGNYTDPITGRAMVATNKAITSISRSMITDTYTSAWNRAFCLYDKRDLATQNKAGTTTEAWLNANTIDGVQCVMSGKSRQQNGTTVTSANLDGAGYQLIVPPQITGITGWDGNVIAVGVHNKSVIIVNGNYFGITMPTAALEYTDTRGNLKQQRLKIQRVYTYPDAKGVANKSIMNITTGASTIYVEMPTKWWTGWGTVTSYSLILTNKLGLDTVDVPTQPAGSNTNPTATPDTFTAQSGESSYIIDVLANDSDPEADKLTILLPAKTTAKGARISVSSGKIRYTPPRDIAAKMTALAGADFDDVFNYTASDGMGGTNTTTVTVSIKPITITGRLKWDGLNALVTVKGRSQIILQGTNFGVRSFKVTMEYTDAVTARVYSKTLRAVGVPKYADYKGKANQSYTDLDPTSGTFEQSEIMVELPSAFNPAVPGVRFKITNKFTSLDDVGNDFLVGPANTFTPQNDDFTGVGSSALLSGNFDKTNYYLLDVLADNGSGVDTSNNSGKFKIILPLRTSTKGGRLVVDTKTNQIKYYRPTGVIGAIVGDTFTYKLQDAADRTIISAPVTVTLDVNLNP